MGNKIKVLVVDDTESVAVSIAMILNDGRYDVVTASNGREAWELLNRGEKFDVIISDYNMPKMNGIGLLLNVRNDSRQEVVDIPFILMSGNRAVSDEDPTPLEEMCVKYGACFLAKPFSITGLVALLEDAGGF